ncbi:MAG: hypothetical protein IKZ07_00645 [Akkermansia sp.]|nr:hypothetical protein [Akkermansia sp.]
MTIPPQATQEELESILSAGMRHSARMVLLAGVLLSPFCYLRCLLNPLWVLGLKVPGIFVTALFGCYVGWQYVNGNPAAGETALLWWAVWAAIMFIIHYIFYTLQPINLYRQSKKYQPAIIAEPDSASAITAPQTHPIKLHKNAEGYLHSEVLLHAPKRGLYALRWEIGAYDGEFCPRRNDSLAHPIWSEQTVQEKNTLTELYRLEAGTHRLNLQLSDRDAARPESATLTQLNM